MRYNLASQHIRRAAVGSAYRASEGILYLNAVLMLALGQCAQDELQLLYNTPQFKGQCAAEKAAIRSAFDHQRRHLKRGVSADDFARFETVVCDVTDECWKRTEWLNATIKGELSQKVPFQKVDIGAYLGISHGLTYACNQLHRKVTGRGCSDYERVLEEIERMDRKVGFELLNSDREPDQIVCAEAIVKLIEDMEGASLKVLTEKREGGQQ